MKICAIGAVVGFAGFLIFGFLAFFASDDIGAMQMVDIALAVIFLVLGFLAWRRLSRGICDTPFGRS